MARYSLRNQHKIVAALGQPLLDRMINSLKKHFADNKEIKTGTMHGEIYPVVLVSDMGHSENIFVFYHLKTTFDVYNLAYKETIG